MESSIVFMKVLTWRKSSDHSVELLGCETSDQVRMELKTNSPK